MTMINVTSNNVIPVRTAVARFNDGFAPMLRIQYVDKSTDPENPNKYCEWYIDNNGSTASKLLICLNIGEDATDYTQYQFSAYATGVTDPAGVDSSPTHTQCTTLKALINALNDIDGITAHRLHAPADYSLDTDDFIDVGTVATPTGGTKLGPLFVDLLHADASEVLVTALRLGIPENVNGKIGRGRLELLRVNSLFTHTTGVFKVSYDPNETDETEEEELGYTRSLGTTSTITELWSFYTNPPVHKGPLLFEISSAALTASDTAAWFTVDYRNAEH